MHYRHVIAVFVLSGIEMHLYIGRGFESHPSSIHPSSMTVMLGFVHRTRGSTDYTVQALIGVYSKNKS